MCVCKTLRGTAVEIGIGDRAMMMKSSNM